LSAFREDKYLCVSTYIMIVTILGSCRQDSIFKLENVNVTSIRDNVSYPHYSNEIIEVIKFCKYGHISPEETVAVMRTPILQKSPICSSSFKDEFDSTTVFVIEIASRKAYKLNGRYVHHILYDDDVFGEYRDRIQLVEESDEEIESNILWLKKELARPIVIVSHITTYNSGSRYDLTKLLETICLKHNILFLNPTIELSRRGFNLKELLDQEVSLVHYNETGHSAIKDVYKEYLVNVNRKKVILVFSDKLANVKQDSNGYYFGLGDLFRGVISMFQLSKKYQFDLFVDFQHHALSGFLEKQHHPYVDLISENKENITYLKPDNVEEYIVNCERNVCFFMTNNTFDDPVTEDCKEFVKKLLIPQKDMETYIENKRGLIPYDEYNIVHYRLGDDELVKNSVNESLLIGAAQHFLNNDVVDNCVLISDSAIFKRIVKSNRAVFMFDIDIAHSGFSEHRTRLRDTLFEFFIVTRCKSIRTSSIYGWPSGFVKIAADVYDVPLTIVT